MQFLFLFFCARYKRRPSGNSLAINLIRLLIAATSAGMCTVGEKENKEAVASGGVC